MILNSKTHYFHFMGANLFNLFKLTKKKLKIIVFPDFYIFDYILR